MATKAFILWSSGDKEVALGCGLVYPLNVAKNKWMDEVKVIIFGPSEKLAAYSPEVQEKLKELREAGIEIIACKWYADRMNITGMLEEAGIKVVFVGSIISQLLKDGWAPLTF
ncbi:MAG: DsrE family protein [Dehalococcoidales bacterium]